MEEAILPAKVPATGGPVVQPIAGALRRYDPDQGLSVSSKVFLFKDLVKDGKVSIWVNKRQVT